MKKVLTIIAICILFISTGVLAYVSYDLYQENQELEEEIDDLKDEKKSNNTNSSNKENENNDYSTNNSNKENTNNNKIENTFIEEKYSNIKEIKFSTFEKMINEQKSFILLVSQTGCSHCIAFKPVLNSVLKDNSIQAYEIDLTKMNNEELQKFSKVIDVQGTPTTVFLKNGQEEDLTTRIYGNVSADKIISKLKANDYIK